MTLDRRNWRRPEDRPKQLLPFLFFSVLLHGVGLLLFEFRVQEQLLPVQRQELTPIEFVELPNQLPEEEPPPETERRAVVDSVARESVQPELPLATEDAEVHVEADSTANQSSLLQTTTPQPPPAPPLTPPPTSSVSPTPPVRQPEPMSPAQPEVDFADQPQSVASSTPREDSPSPSGTVVTPALPQPEPKAFRQPELAELPSVETSTQSDDPAATPAPAHQSATEPIAAAPPALDSPPAEPVIPEPPAPSGPASLLAGTADRSIDDNTGDFRNQIANANRDASGSASFDAQQDVDLGPYLSELWQRVRRYWHPDNPGSNHHTVVGFSVNRDGQISNLRVLKTSGSTVTDDEAIAAIRQAAPFAALPSNFPRERLNLEFAFNIYVSSGAFQPQLQRSWHGF